MPEGVYTALESPISALVVCLLLGAVAMSGKFSQLAAHLCLVGACIVGALGIFRAAIHQPRLSLGGILMLVGFCLILSYWIRPVETSTVISPPPTLKPPPETPKPEIRGTTDKVEENAAHSKKPSGTPVPPKPTLLSLFNTDLAGTMKLTDDAIGIQWQDGTVLHIKRQLYLDFPAKAKFVGFYVPSSDPLSSAKSLEACLRLVEAVQQALDDMPKKVYVSGGYKGEMNTIQELTFSGRVLIYHDAFLSIVQKAAIINAYSSKNFDVQFRGPEYLGDQLIAWHHKYGPK